jgi:hypothetical protein
MVSVNSRRTLTLACNSDAINDTLLRVLDRSSVMVQARAYLHWYTRYGVEESQFYDAFDTLGAVVRAYAGSGGM